MAKTPDQIKQSMPAFHEALRKLVKVPKKEILRRERRAKKKGRKG